MNYFKVKWKHSFPDEPVWIYSEVDENRWELRKIEIFSNGRIGYASPTESTGETRLAEEPIPPLIKISNDPQFEPSEISKSEFEEIWNRRETNL